MCNSLVFPGYSILCMLSDSTKKTYSSIAPHDGALKVM